MWRASVLTIFPEMFPGPLGVSLAGKALGAGLWSLDAVDIRDAATDKHRTVDDTPAGGGPGMVMKADVLAAALDAIPVDGRPRLLMSARGLPLTQNRVAALAAGMPVPSTAALMASAALPAVRAAPAARAFFPVRAACRRSARLRGSIP